MKLEALEDPWATSIYTVNKQKFTNSSNNLAIEFRLAPCGRWLTFLPAKNRLSHTYSSESLIILSELKTVEENMDDSPLLLIGQVLRSTP